MEIEEDEYEIEMLCFEDEEDGEDFVDNIVNFVQPGRIAVRGAEAHQFEPPGRENRDINQDEDLPQDEDFYRGRRDNRDEWCSCNNCIVLPHFQDFECRCCREIPETRGVADLEEATCVINVANFEQAILNPLTLFLAWGSFTEKYRQQASSFENRGNEKYRYVAYRQLVRLCWGYLGKNIRVTTPACAHALIDNSYPDGQNQYRGTILRRLEDDDDD